MVPLGNLVSRRKIHPDNIQFGKVGARGRLFGSAVVASDSHCCIGGGGGDFQDFARLD